MCCALVVSAYMALVAASEFDDAWEEILHEAYPDDDDDPDDVGHGEG